MEAAAEPAAFELATSEPLDLSAEDEAVEAVAAEPAALEPVEASPIAAPAEPVPSAAEAAHERRIAQLIDEGFGDFFRPADACKTILFPAETMPQPPALLRSPGFKKEFGKFHGRLGGTLPPSGYYRFENVYIGQSGTVVSDDRRILWSADLISAYWMRFLARMVARDALGLTSDQSGELPPSTPISRFLARQPTDVRVIEPEGATLICLIKPGSVVYGHWILDAFPMLWQLRRCVEAGELKGPFRYLINSHIEPWVLDMLEMLFDITANDLIFVDEASGIVQVPQVIVPSLLRVSPLISPRVNEFVDYVLARMLPRYTGDIEALPRRFYISRSAYAKLHNKMLMNNEALIEALAAEGIVTIEPEKMPWPEQLALFSRAELSIGEFGSGMHNALFSPPSTRSIVLSHMKRNWNQSAIAAIRGQSIAYVQPSEEQRTGLGLGVTYSYDPQTVVDLARELSAKAPG